MDWCKENQRKENFLKNLQKYSISLIISPTSKNWRWYFSITLEYLRLETLNTNKLLNVNKDAKGTTMMFSGDWVANVFFFFINGIKFCWQDVKTLSANDFFQRFFLTVTALEMVILVTFCFFSQLCHLVVMDLQQWTVSSPPKETLGQNSCTSKAVTLPLDAFALPQVQ